MVIHRSRFKKTLGNHARGEVYYSDEKEFRVSRNIIKINEKSGLEEKVRVFYIFKKEECNYYQKPSRNTEVLMRYPNLKSKQGKYDDSKKNLPFEVLTLRGELVYREKFF